MGSFETYSREKFSNKLGLADHLESDEDQADPSPWGIARLIRREVRRHGLATRRELRRAIEPFLDASGFSCDANKAIQSVASRMVDVGELADLKVENQRGYSALPSRWIKLSDTDAVLLGTTATETHRFSSFHPNQFLRRFRPTDAIVNDLARIGVVEQSFKDWLGEPNWKSLIDQTDEIDSLADFLAWHINQLDEEGSPLDVNDTKVLAINHHAGDFFGSERNPQHTRWASPSTLQNGVYLGAQPGRNEQHWIPVLLRIDGRLGKSMTLNSRNSSAATFELRNWLLIAMGASNEKPELIDVKHLESELQCTFPVPSQVSTLLGLIGEPTGKWQRYAVLDVHSTCQWISRGVPELQFRHHE